ncbi:MAG: pilus assembly protein PilM, partial [Acidimicrobiales bacterium]
MDTLRRANLHAVAVDVPQAALVRGARVHGRPGPFALVSVGADLTNVVVGTPSSGTYSRTLAVGARGITGGLGIRLGVELHYAEAVKRYASGGQQAAVRASHLVADEARPIVEQIRESLEYFLSRTDVDQLDTVMLTGGGALTPGFANLLQDAVGAPVQTVDAFAGLDAPQLDVSLRSAAHSVMLEATGLGAWGWELPARRISLLPPEVVAARQRQRMAVAGAAAAGVLVLGLGGAWYDKHQQVSTAQAATVQAKAQSHTLQDASRSFGAISSYFTAVDARQTALKGIAGGVDWPALVRQISAAMPANTSLQQLSVGANPGGASASTTS